MAALPVLAALLLLVYAGAAPTAPSAACYRRANVTLADCAITTPSTKGGWYTTWTRPPPGSSGPWGEHVGLNCFTNKAQGWKGGTTIPPEPFSRSIALAACQSACLADPHCSAVVMPTQAPRPPPPTPTPDGKAKALQQHIAAAIASGAHSLTIAGGTYHFGTANLEIEGATALFLLSPQPVQLVFSGSAGVNITSCVDLSLGNWTIDYADAADHHAGAKTTVSTSSGGSDAITLNLLNSTRVSVTDVSILHAKFMVVTAFNGGGDHHFTRLRFAPTIGRHCRDALHFTDQRIGSTFENCTVRPCAACAAAASFSPPRPCLLLILLIGWAGWTGAQIGFSGDDLFNMHTTLMVVLKCESPTSCLMVNPHLSDKSRRNTVYGSNSVMEMLVPVSKLRQQQQQQQSRTLCP
eukprot:COSAG01_NODE_10957_length_2039_cov_4.858763_1_plen_409_part_00